jgi:outer membrane protein TolC
MKNFISSEEQRAILRVAVTVLTTIVFSGCTTFSPDGGFGVVEQRSKQLIGKDVKWVKSDADRNLVADRVTELLKNPLSVDDAVQIALLNNQGLQAAYAELGIAEADLVQAGRLPNPGFSIGRLTRGSEVEIERGLHLNLIGLLLTPFKSEMEQRRFQSVQNETAATALKLAAQTRKAYFNAVAADEGVRYMMQVKEAADASAELARRMAQTGNWNKLNQAREQGFYADAVLNLARSLQMQTTTREQLTRLLGLWGEQIEFVLPERLPDLPKAVDDLPDIEQTAMAQRLDIAAMKMQTESLAKNLGLNKATRFINVLELGGVRNSSNVQPTQHGYAVSLELPLFDWGGAKVAKAEAIYMQWLNLTAEAATNARSEVREAYKGYRSSYDIAKHYRDEIVPIKKRIADENLLRYNGMLIGVFELLADARSQIGSVNNYIESLRDFWLAQSDMQMALIGKPSMSAAQKAMLPVDSGMAGH